MSQQPQLKPKRSERSDFESRHKSTGTLFYQQAPVTQKQIQNIYQYFTSNNRKLHKAPMILFSDNDVDNDRSDNQARIHSDGQAQHCGQYDRSICYGITTKWYSTIQWYEKEDTNNNNNFKQLSWDPLSNKKQFEVLIDNQFEKVMEQVIDGKDIICPATQNNNNSRVQHDIGTGNLKKECLEYIQSKLDEIARVANMVKTIYQPKIYGMNQVVEQRQEFKSHSYDENSDLYVYSDESSDEAPIFSYRYDTQRYTIMRICEDAKFYIII